ncbi:hypothetical protein [Chryseobacterium oryctis]|uniref:Uncharacterized protein n=1 Tax=Chryseobacterium oryctis TaxID=2952618 RepID=A0ABT3HT38_9FLAO|nr:hypothetical protein [Chryseobacterium oryctis]MCW3162850.1 hypothetical protein [Chryseobacterium oryctis]
MASTSETGHAKNIANLQDLISFCKGYADQYNPVKESLKIDSLETLYQDALQKLTETQNKKTLFDNATDDRINAFKDLNPLATKIINSLAVSGVSKLTVDNAKGFNKKLQGKSAKSTEIQTIAKDGEPTPKTISTSQQSYDSKIAHFSNMLQVLTESQEYNPNEEELKTTALQNKLTDLQAKNTALINAYTDYSNAKIKRDQKLYDPLIGLVQTAQEVKLYVKSVFGATSPQYKQVSGLQFTRAK